MVQNQGNSIKLMIARNNKEELKGSYTYLNQYLWKISFKVRENGGRQ